MKAIILLFFTMLLASLAAQQTVTVSGTLTDAENGETLIGATVWDSLRSNGTQSNVYGFYSLEVPANIPLVLRYSFVGYQNKDIVLQIGADTVIDVELSSGLALEEVLVKANSFQERVNSTQMSVEAVTTEQAKKLPAVLGEVDIIKTLQLKPGISSGSEGSAGLFVRGGGNDQNLIVLDEAVVYNANHLFGFFSTFNSDAIKDVKIYKGGFPAEYGGRLSSVVDVRLKEGNRKKFAASGGIGLLSTRLTLEGPIQKEKSSFLVSGRRTYVDLFTRAINRSREGDPDFDPIPDYFFYDLNAKANIDLGKKDRLFVSGYFGRDVFNFKNDNFDFDFNWGNATGTVRWNHTFSNKLFSNTTFTYSNYEYNINNDLDGFSFSLRSDINDVNFKTDFYYALSARHSIKFGAVITNHQFEVGRLSGGSDDGQVSFNSGLDLAGTELGVYVSDEYEPTDRLLINYGLRLSGFVNDGEWSTGLEPRLALRYRLNDRLSVKGSYARMYQYLHLLSNSSLTLPTDIWYPTTENVRSQVSDQVAVGWVLALGDAFLITNEYYYKWLDRVVDFKDFAQLFANEEIERELAFGDGFAYGAELGIERTKGRFTGWLAYTLSFIRRGNFSTIEGIQIDEGRYFAPRYDQRHDLSVVGLYELNGRLSLSGTFVYKSGDLGWLPVGRFVLQDIPGADPRVAVPDFQERNTFRQPPYMRLDVGFVYDLKPRKGVSNITFSIYNVLNRRNPYFVYLEPETESIDVNNGQTVEVIRGVTARQVSLFPIIPGITWNFEY